MDYAADDVLAIKVRLEQILKENTLAIYRLEDMANTELDTIGTYYDMPRHPAENDYYYRLRLKDKVGLI